MLYIVKRTQLYIDEGIFEMLATLSRKQKTTISDLVRKAVEKVYGRKKNERDKIKALKAAFGIWKNRKDLPPTDEYIRQLRKDTRAERLGFPK